LFGWGCPLSFWTKHTTPPPPPPPPPLPPLNPHSTRPPPPPPKSLLFFFVFFLCHASPPPPWWVFCASVVSVVCVESPFISCNTYSPSQMPAAVGVSYSSTSKSFLPSLFPLPLHFTFPPSSMLLYMSPLSLAIPYHLPYPHKDTRTCKRVSYFHTPPSPPLVLPVSLTFPPGDCSVPFLFFFDLSAQRNS